MLRHHVSERPDAVCLDFPDEDVTYTYREALERAEHVAHALQGGGGTGRPGRPHGPELVVRPHLVGTAVGGLVEVLINTNYEGEFLRHQLVVAQARTPSSTTCRPSGGSPSPSTPGWSSGSG